MLNHLEPCFLTHLKDPFSLLALESHVLGLRKIEVWESLGPRGKLGSASEQLDALGWARGCVLSGTRLRTP